MAVGFGALAYPADASAPVPPLLKEAKDFTLYGDASGGWGFGKANITNPGPDLYVYQGENISITLYAADGIQHDWFIDFNGNRVVDPSEVKAPTFASATTPIVFNFTVPTDRTGPFTYRCHYHPTTMTGIIYVLTRPVITLYGSQLSGWGLSNNTTRNPGPTLYMLYGTNLTIHLVSLDGPRVSHTWFVDYNDDGASSGEPSSSLFNSTAPTTYVFTPGGTGNYTYRCAIHPTIMTGQIVIAGVAPAVHPGFQIDLIPGIMVATIVAVLVLAAIYQVRAVHGARRPK